MSMSRLTRIKLTVFFSGMSMMAVEMTASRILAPYFGSSLFVWTNIIGIIMIALSVGYYIGGRVGDRYNSESLLYKIVLTAGISISAVPILTRSMLLYSMVGANVLSFNIVVGSFIATVIMFATPVMLLGFICPYAIRLTAKNLDGIGVASGSIYALSTVGSIIGTFVPALVTIPLLGSMKTMFFFSVLLSSIALFFLGGRRYVVLAAFVLLILLYLPLSVKPTRGLLFEKESVHNYIRLKDVGGKVYLVLDEGLGVPSIYDPEDVFPGGYYNYAHIGPLFVDNPSDILILGLACGVVSRGYLPFYNASIDGVELDDEVVEACKEYTDLGRQNISIHIMDGRVFLSRTEKKYDVIFVDVYKSYHIPFHFTTREFFREASDHLKDDGVVLLNLMVSRRSRVFDLITRTLSSEFSRVYVVPVTEGAYDETEAMNFLVLGTENNITLGELRDKVEKIEDEELRSILDNSLGVLEVIEKDEGTILSDDNAPIEFYTNLMFYDFWLRYRRGLEYKL